MTVAKRAGKFGRLLHRTNANAACEHKLWDYTLQN